jgi:hypothetical protein
MKYVVEMASGCMTYIPSFTTIGSGIRVVLRLLPQQNERLQCWYCGIYEVCSWDGLRWHDIHVHIKFHEDWYKCFSSIEVLP